VKTSNSLDHLPPVKYQMHLSRELAALSLATTCPSSKFKCANLFLTRRRKAAHCAARAISRRI